MEYITEAEEIKRIILPVLEEMQTELVELKLVKGPGGLILKLLVDKDKGGINLDECAQINKKIGEILDCQDIIKNKYILEASSPGLDRPLKTKNDFLRCMDRRVKFFLKENIEGKLEIDGQVLDADEETVEVNAQGKNLRIPFSKINKAKQLIEQYFKEN